jgi:hypothetical protein
VHDHHRVPRDAVRDRCDARRLGAAHASPLDSVDPRGPGTRCARPVSPPALG